MATVWRGVNDAGGEFAHTVTPGVLDTDYHYDSLDTFKYIAGRGNKIVRLPFLWERVQPTRGAALDATLLANFKAYVKRATDAGLKVLLDMHNYARRYEGGVEKIMGTDFPASDLVDVWTRLSTEFKADANVIAYGIMNEPHSLSGLSTTTGSELVANPGFETDLTGWGPSGSTIVRDTTVFRSGVASMKVTSTGAADGRATFGGIAVTAGSTYAVGYDARGNATSAGLNTFVGIDWFDSAGAYLTSTFVDYFGLADGSWKRHLLEVTAPAGAATATLIPGFQATAADQVMWVDDVTWKAGTVTTGAKRWEQASQDVVTAIRNNSDTKTIHVPGYEYSSAKNWATIHPEPWITDSANAHLYEGHFYFDRDNSGKYVNTYADENTDAVNRGYVDLKARALDELDNFTAWLTAKGVKGFVGEIGWPNTGDTAAWNAVGDALYTLLDQQKVGATFWSAGEWWHLTYLLSIYTGTPHDTATSIAATVEAHPTIAATAGSGDATATSTAAGAGSRVAVGSASGTSAATGSAAGSVVATGAGSATAGSTGAGQGAPVPTGSGAATSSSTASGTGIVVRTGTAAGTVAATGDGTGTPVLLGAGAATTTGVGAASGAAVLTGTAAASAASTAAGAGHPVPTGAGGATSTSTATGEGTAVPAGSAGAATSTSTAIGAGSAVATGAGSATAGSVAALTGRVVIIGAAAATTTSTASGAGGPVSAHRDITVTWGQATTRTLSGALTGRTLTAGPPATRTLTATLRE